MVSHGVLMVHWWTTRKWKRWWMVKYYPNHGNFVAWNFIWWLWVDKITLMDQTLEFWASILNPWTKFTYLFSQISHITLSLKTIHILGSQCLEEGGAWPLLLWWLPKVTLWIEKSPGQWSCLVTYQNVALLHIWYTVIHDMYWSSPSMMLHILYSTQLVYILYLGALYMYHTYDSCLTNLVKIIEKKRSLATPIWIFQNFNNSL